MRNSCPRRCYEGNKLSNMLIDKILCNPYFLRTIYKCNKAFLLALRRHKDLTCYTLIGKACARTSIKSLNIRLLSSIYVL